MLRTTERRKSKRFSTRLRVFEQETNALIGYCDDISISGLKLMSSVPLPANKELQVWLDGAGKDDGIPLILFRVWNSVTDTEPRYYYAGMHIVEASEQALDRIQELIDHLFVKN